MMNRRLKYLPLSAIVLLLSFCNAQNAPSYKGKTVGTWVNGLRDTDLKTKLEAAEALGAIGAQGASISVPALTAMLKTPMTPFRMGGEEGLTSAELLDTEIDDDAQFRVAVMKALGIIGPAAKNAVAVILPMFHRNRVDSALDSKDVNAKIKNAKSLDQIPLSTTRNFIKAMKGDNACFVAAHDSLVKIGSAAVSGLIAALSNPSANIRSGAARTLGDLGSLAKAAIPALEAVSKNDSFEGAKKNASEALEKIRIVE